MLPRGYFAKAAAGRDSFSVHGGRSPEDQKILCGRLEPIWIGM
jgi:hypothetical protein